MGQCKQKRNKELVFTIIALVVIALIITIVIIRALTRKHHNKLDTSEADIIIVGGGTAGCIIARRLSERFPHKHILILDRGVDRRNDPIVYNIKNQVTAGYSLPYSETLPTGIPGVVAAQSLMIGGCSSHNFSLAVRGSPDIYNGEWKTQLGLSYNDLLPYFARIESYQPATPSTSKLRFTTGRIQITPLPTKISLLPRLLPALKLAGEVGLSILVKGLKVITDTGPLRASDTLSNNIVQALNTTRGVPVVDDYNTDVVVCTSVSPQLFVDSRVGIRQSTDVTYLDGRYIYIDQESRGKNRNLQLSPNSTVTNITSTGVDWITEEGAKKNSKLKENGRVIVCAGGLYSPFLLLKSGFTVPELGQNLRAHYGFNAIVAAEATQDENFLFSSGPLAFLSRTTANIRDWQLVVSGSVTPQLLATIQPIPGVTDNTRFFTILLWNLKPRAPGTIGIDPDTPNKPKVSLNLFLDGTIKDPGSDISSLIAGLRYLHTGLVQELKKSYPTLRLVYPPAPVLERDNPVELEKYINNGISLTDHYSRTCKLGTVVDPTTFLLSGTKNIHVADASVFPTIPDGNTNYPTCLIGEIAADRIGSQL